MKPQVDKLVTFPFVCVVLLGLAIGHLSTTQVQAATGVARPNVILVMTDDQGYGDVGANGNTMIRTPHLDRLHGQSVRLTDFHVDPTCSPTRSALMTGRYSSRTGVWHTIMGRSLMRRDEVTLGDVFAQNGYATAMFGKWHLGDNYPLRPQDRGFQEVLCHGGGGISQTPDFWGNDYFDDRYWHNGKPQQYTGYCTDVFFDGALQFIQKNKDQPFFAYIATNTPHGPLNVAEKYSKPYEEKGVPSSMAKFYGMIENIDENMGRLLAKLDAWGLDENTIVIFMTDNGTASGVIGGGTPKKGPSPSDDGWRGFNDGMRGQKGSEYDGGHRVPCFFRWPAGGIEGGRDVEQLSAHVDILPTLSDLCGLKRDEQVKVDGSSLAPLLRAEATSWPERTLFVHSQRIEHPEQWRKSAVMTERWRLVNGAELYDIQADHGQAENLAAAQPEVVARLREAYDGWWEGLSERFDEYVEIVIGSDEENPARITCHDWHGENVPWNQGAIRSAPAANGFWAIDVQRDGTYEFTLREQPTEADFPIQANEARLEIGDVDVSGPIEPGATGVTFTVDLRAGKTRMETWLTDAKSGKSRGAFFVYVRRR
ncbi:MAG TPA: arylsulfatase [Thermoguttaceae bacterium]|nr:arylsulfatase [Thermoguttaceae bacterium]